MIAITRLFYMPWKVNHSPRLSVQFSSVTQSCLTLCDPMNHSTPGLPVHHQLPEFTQTHVHRVGDAVPTISSSTALFFFCLQSFPASRSFPTSPLLSCLLFSSVQFSHSVVSDSLRPHESQHARPPCPSPTPGVHSDSRPLSQ